MGFRSPQLRTRGPLKKPDVSRCAARGRRQTARCCGSPFRPHLRRLREPWTRGRSGGIRSRGAGRGARGARPRGRCGLRASRTARTPLGERPLLLAHPGPSLGSGATSFLLRTPLCRTSRIFAQPCVSLAPPPALPAGYFYPQLVKGGFGWGGWGILGNRGQIHSLCAPLAPRSGPLLAGSSR